MKICTAVCEYNPLHNGHLQHISYIKTHINPDYLIIFMSGNFVQRGEISVLDKYARAKHAVLAGADAVIELPTVFATATAEIFAKGAIKLINTLPEEKFICFGLENSNKESLIKTASVLSYETKEFTKVLKQELDKGEPLIKARITALKSTVKEEIDYSFLESPNNILGLEYAKAIIKNGYNIEIETIQRVGGGYNDSKLLKNLSSATAIRKAIEDGKLRKIKKQVPLYVYKDLPKTLPNVDNLAIYSILSKTNKELKLISDCAEGLENRLQHLAKENYTVKDLVFDLKTKRYTDARLNRIITANMLNIQDALVKQALKSDLYLKVLAVNNNKKDVLNVISKSKYPKITRKADVEGLKGIAKECFLKDVLANDLYNLVTQTKTNEFQTLFIDN